MTTTANHFGHRLLSEEQHKKIDEDIKALLVPSALCLDEAQKRMATIGCILGDNTVEDDYCEDDYLGIPTTFRTRIQEALHKDLKNVKVPRRARRNLGNPGMNQELALLLARSEVLLKRALARRAAKLKVAIQLPDITKAVNPKQCSEPLSPTYLKWLKSKDDVMPD